MKYSQRLNIEIKLSKEIIIDLYENCLRPIIFKDLEVIPTISCTVRDQKIEAEKLTLNDFKNEIFNDSVIDEFSMIIMQHKIDREHELVILKSPIDKDNIVVSLSSYDKMWVNENLKIIENFLEKQKEKDKLEYIEASITTNEQQEKQKNPWQRAEIIGVITVIVSVVIAAIGWSFFR